MKRSYDSQNDKLCHTRPKKQRRIYENFQSACKENKKSVRGEKLPAPDLGQLQTFSVIKHNG